MPQINDKAIFYDGTTITFRKIVVSKKGIVYYFHELPYGLNEAEFEHTSILLAK